MNNNNLSFQKTSEQIKNQNEKIILRIFPTLAFITAGVIIYLLIALVFKNETFHPLWMILAVSFFFIFVWCSKEMKKEFDKRKPIE